MEKLTTIKQLKDKSLTNSCNSDLFRRLLALCLLIGLVAVVMTPFCPIHHVADTHGVSPEVSAEAVAPKSKFRTQPRRFAPLHPPLIDRTTLDYIVHHIRNRLPPNQPALSTLQHCLRVANAKEFGSTFPFEFYGHPDQLLHILCNAPEAQRKLSMFSADKLFVEAEHGLHVGVSGVDCGPYDLCDPHFCHMLSVLAEHGVSLKHPFTTLTGYQCTLHEVLQQACAEYTIRHEPEFFAFALVHYLKPPFAWSGISEVKTLDALLNHLVKAELGFGVCEGTHVLHSIALCIRLDMQTPYLSHATRRAAETRLRQASSRLEHSQQADGSWCNWVSTSNPSKNAPARIQSLSTTSHHLEWICLLPEEFRPNSTATQNALEYIIGHLIMESQNPFTEDYLLATSHALKAMASYADATSFDTIDSKVEY